MTKFLPASSLYRVLQRELPEDVYIDGSPSAGFSTADNYSIAKSIETSYSNLERIYDNSFPHLADELIDEWESTVFINPQPALGTLAERQDRVVQKLRQRRGITLWDILTLVAGRVPEGTYVQIREWQKERKYAWRLGISKLGLDTYLGYSDEVDFSFVNDCDFFRYDVGWRLGTARLGIETKFGPYTYLQVAFGQMKSYVYEVRIFDHTLTNDEIMALDVELKAAEPARSPHFIFNNVDLASAGLSEIVNDVDQFSGVNCITRDSGSSTGYTGRQHG